MGNYIQSFIMGKYAYKFNRDYGKITHNSTLDVNGDFELGFQIKPDDDRPDGTLFSKNDNSGNYLAANITIHTYMINYYLYVEISDGAKKLAYKTDNQIFLSYKAVQADIQWNQSTKTLLIKKDGVATNITLFNPTSNYYSASSSFGSSINVLINADMFFAYSNGLTAFKGTFYGGIFTNAYVSDSDVYAYYQTVKDIITQPPSDYILFSYITPETDPSYGIFSMTSKGENITLKKSGAGNLEEVNCTIDGTQIAYTDKSDNTIHVANSSFGSVYRVSGVTGANPAFSPNKTKVLYDYGQVVYLTPNNNSGTTGNAMFQRYDSVGSYWDFSSASVSPTMIGGEYKVIALCKNYGYGNYYNLIRTTYYEDSSVVPNYYQTEHLLTLSISDQISKAHFNADSTKIGLSICYSGGKFNLYIMDNDGGNLTQITSDTTKDNYFAGFSPDNNKVLFYDSNNNIFTCNLDGGLVKQLNNSAYPSNMPTWVYN